MTIYKYFGRLCKSIASHNVYNRNSYERWLEAMSVEDFEWCVEKGFLVESAPMLKYGESTNTKYYEFSRKGKELFDWYVYDTWFYIKYKIFHWHYIKHKLLRGLFKHHLT
jgi:hypothetical protein